MRAYLPEFTAHRAATLAEALTRLAEPPHPQLGAWQPLAGGTDLMVLLAAGKLPPGRYLDLWRLDELRGIAATASHVELGALTTYTQVREHPLLHAEFPMLVQAAAESGAHAIQNRGTLGGNIANASPAADSPPALLAYAAELELVSATGTRVVPYAEFHLGYKKMLLRPGELIRRVRLPRLPEAARREAVHFYRKVGTRRAQAISKVCMAALLVRDGTRPTSCRIAFGSVAPIPLFCPRSAAALLEAAPLLPPQVADLKAVLATELAPIDDIRSTSGYRLRVAQNLIAQFGEICRAATSR